MLFRISKHKLARPNQGLPGLALLDRRPIDGRIQELARAWYAPSYSRLRYAVSISEMLYVSGNTGASINMHDFQVTRKRSDQFFENTSKLDRAIVAEYQHQVGRSGSAPDNPI
jgi:hypothetical protein